MAIPSATNRNDYVGSSAVHVYAYSYRILLESHLRLTVRDLLGNETTLTINTDYTVDGVRNASGGNITLVNSGQAWLTAGELTTGFSLTIRRVLPLTQLTDFRNQGDFFPETHEDEFDRGVMVAQQQQDELARSMRLPETEAGSAAATTIPLSADRASKFLAFDASGNPIASAGVSDVPVSAFMATVVDDASGPAALTTLRNDLLAETAPAVADEVFLYDASVLTVDRITLENLLKVINSLAEDASPSLTADFLLSYDTSAAAVKKVKPGTITDAAIAATTVIPTLGDSLLSALVVANNAGTPNSKVDVTANRISIGGVVLSSVSLTADITASGANGLDTGVEALSTWYALFVITNDSGTLVASLLSTSQTPTLPSGYTKYRRVAWVRNNAASNFLPFRQEGRSLLYNDPSLNVSLPPDGTTTVSFAIWIPPTVRSGKFNVQAATGVGGADIGQTVGFRISTSYAFMTVGQTRGSAGNNLSSMNYQVFQTDASQQIIVIVSNVTASGDGTTIWVMGYEDSAI